MKLKLKPLEFEKSGTMYDAMAFGAIYRLRPTESGNWSVTAGGRFVGVAESLEAATYLANDDIAHQVRLMVESVEP